MFIVRAAHEECSSGKVDHFKRGAGKSGRSEGIGGGGAGNVFGVYSVVYLGGDAVEFRGDDAGRGGDGVVCVQSDGVLVVVVFFRFSVFGWIGEFPGVFARRVDGGFLAGGEEAKG